MKAADAIPTEQRRRSSCGAACVKNALRLLGTRVTEAKCRRLCGTTDDGTDEQEILAGLRALGYGGAIINTTDDVAALAGLDRHLQAGRPVIACVDLDDHWVLVCDTDPDGVIVHDPASEIEIVGEQTMMKRWANSKGEYYGIAVKAATEETQKRARRQRRPDLAAAARRNA